MKAKSRAWLFGGLALVLASVSCRRPAVKKSAAAPPGAVSVSVNWTKVTGVSATTPTLQVVVNPLLRRGSAIHDRVFQALHDLGANYVRYVPWLPYPKLAVAEMEPPANGKTSWDFSLIDPMMEDFMNATAGHSVIINFSTIPEWMWKTPKPAAYPSDPNQVTWTYEQGTELRDPTMKQVADYYARVVSWYTKGGFKDEYGKWHASSYHYKIPYWEVLNEINGEHRMSPEFYTRLYDAIVQAILRVQPRMKFVGLAYGGFQAAAYFEYFLNHQHHKPGIPLDMISYHFYAVPTPDETVHEMQYDFFAQADHFLGVVQYNQAIRERLSPQTGADVDELGCIVPAYDGPQGRLGPPPRPIPNAYWNLCGAMYAYVYGHLAGLGVNVAGESQMVGYPSQFPSVSMVDWKTGQPNARFWVLKLLVDNLGAGDRLVATGVNTPYIYGQGFVTPDGKEKLLLVNRRNRSFEVTIPGGAGATEAYVDQTTAFQPPASRQMGDDKLLLGGFGVAIITLKR